MAILKKTYYVCSDKFLKIAKEYADEFIADVKIPKADLCKSLLGGNVGQYLNNLKHLDLKIATFRIPVCEYTLQKDNVDLILDLLKEFTSKNWRFLRFITWSKGNMIF